MLNVTKMNIKFTEDYISIFCEKNSDGTQNLRLKGNELNFRIKKRIKDKHMPIVASFLNSNNNVIKLDLAYNPITDNGFQILVEQVLSKENNILHLNLVGCDLTFQGVQKLSEAWNTLKLKTLRLTGNKIGHHAAAALETILLKVPTLEHLDVGETNQTLASIPYYCACLRTDIGKNTTLKTLDISNIVPPNEYYQFDSSILADHVGEMIKMNSALVELHMQKCNLDGHDVNLLMLGLKVNKSLLLLDIGFNRINNYGAEIIAKWLEESRPNLVGLNISGNSIANIGATALSFGLPFSKIRLLDLSKNKIGDEGLAELLLSIKKKLRVRVFYIWGNQIGPKSLKIIGRQMKAGVYEQKQIDFYIYYTDKCIQAAFYPSDTYKSRYYCQLEHNEVCELRIKRNEIESEFCRTKAKVKFHHFDPIAKCRKDPCSDEETTLQKLREVCEEKEQNLKVYLQ